MRCATFLLVSGLLVVVLTLVSPKACVASSNITTSLGMSMAESNLDSEFVMGSEFGKLVASANSFQTPPSSDASRAHFQCGQGQRYCVPPINPASTKQKCGPYTRCCHSPC
uniref:Uncharacterized protein MANES_01G101700 n=1 Tax=Rhizophora mucronata TaxID=61149 RepID=A0A2P2MKN7_RHIMU